MSEEHRGHLLEEAALRWHHLAERRLAYYTDLLLTGRWRRYYADERAFALRMMDVVKAARAWARIARGQSRDQSRSGTPSSPGKGDDLRPAA